VRKSKGLLFLYLFTNQWLGSLMLNLINGWCCSRCSVEKAVGGLLLGSWVNEGGLAYWVRRKYILFTNIIAWTQWSQGISSWWWNIFFLTKFKLGCTFVQKTCTWVAKFSHGLGWVFKKIEMGPQMLCLNFHPILR
jgi:hypothetical protein